MREATGVDFASVLTKNRGYIGPMRIIANRLLAGLTVIVLSGLSAAMAQTATPADKPAVKPVRSIPYVSITGDDGRQRHYETNAIPLLFNRACFGWRMYLGGPNRVVSLKEVLTTSQPAEQVIAGPETEVSADKTRATTRMFETVQDGVLQRSWCIIPGDPPGTYTYDITIDGEPRGEFVFCAIEVPDQNVNTDPRDLSCPNKFNAVQRAPKRPGAAS
ncbi:hypothetical protein RSO01_67820 [Reyranella soli]|uniref:Uncharacterized protein n=2 Tax=Reyranella soli TaxID=1230389 RepID=A0A512NL05_9HYPH|nr:hypothetical protein RSO01_67820 [Reyranella soli]